MTTEFELDVEAFAHGGHCVGRHEGRVVFVRHALPGERVLARVTEDRGGSFFRADAVSILRAAPSRVEPPCPYAHPGGCGGCDLQHASPAAQRSLKAAVVAEQLERLGGITDVPSIFAGVEELPGGSLGWRTRVQFAVDAQGQAGLHPHRSRDVLPIKECLIADPRITALGVTDLPWPGVAAVEAVASGAGDDAVVLDVVTPRSPASRGRGRPHGPRRAASRKPVVIDLPEQLPEQVAVLAASSPVRNTGRQPADAVRGHRRVREDAGGRRWYVRADGFWQVHPAAPDALAAAVTEALEPTPGDSVLDLYAGAGLFAGVLGPLVGRVVAVEADRGACDDARRNLRDLENVSVVTARVDAALAGGLREPVDLVVLDPPRSGAGAAVVREVAARAPRAVAYVACDPAAFARDVATFAAEGYRLTRVRAFDAFPMTHHVECVGTLVRG